MIRRWMKQIISLLVIVSVICISFHVYVSPTIFSTHAEEITPSIEILNVQSYPKKGGEWSVRFQVRGTADLQISAVEQTTWSNEECSTCDLKFERLQNQTKIFEPLWKNESILITNFSSSTIIEETSLVQSLGKHVLQFTFGNDTVYAYNDASSWWNSNWGYRKKVTINHSQVQGSLYNFPVLINISDSDLQQKANSDGSDIAFISYEDNSTQYDYELEMYVDGDLTAWVKIPHLSSTEDTRFWMYYGNDEATSQENPSQVWTDNYVGVWHFSETNDTNGAKRNDSTSFANDATTQGYDEDESKKGVVYNADYFDGTDYLEIDYDQSLKMNDSNYTISIWMKSSDLWNTERILVEYGAWEEGTYQLTSMNDSNVKTNFYGSSSTVGSHANQVLNDNGWHYLVGTFDNTNDYLSTFFDGILINQTEELNSPDNKNLSMYIASREGSENNFTGFLDELRISKTPRNESWIQTSYNTVQNQTKFFTLDSEESAAPFVDNPYPSDGDNSLPTIPDYFEITVSDPNPELLNITWRTNQSGTWETFNVTNGTGDGVSDGTYQAINTSWITTFDQPYHWSVNVTDGLHWTNETYSFTMHQYNPVINSFSLSNETGCKLNNETGNLDVNKEYVFTINVTDKNGWEDITFINLTSWYDGGDETSQYNESLGGNLNLFLQYQNNSGTGVFHMHWPNNESTLITQNCTEEIINHSTRVISFSFVPGNQTRCATSNETWSPTLDVIDDLYSWNLNCTIEDSLGNKGYYESEYGVNYYSALRAPLLVEITGAPGMSEQSDVFTIDYMSNADYSLTIHFDDNLTQVSGPDVIDIGGNLSVLKNADPYDDITENTTFSGTKEINAITLLEKRSAPANGLFDSVNVQFELYIPFGTWGTYSSQINKKITRI